MADLYLGGPSQSRVFSHQLRHVTSIYHRIYYLFIVIHKAIRVTVPQAPVFITNFHPQATLPPYINPAPAAGYNGTNAYGYPEDEKVPFGSERV